MSEAASLITKDLTNLGARIAGALEDAKIPTGRSHTARFMADFVRKTVEREKAQPRVQGYNNSITDAFAKASDIMLDMVATGEADARDTEDLNGAMESFRENANALHNEIGSNVDYARDCLRGVAILLGEVSSNNPHAWRLQGHGSAYKQVRDALKEFITVMERI